MLHALPTSSSFTYMQNILILGEEIPHTIPQVQLHSVKVGVCVL
jgi:hypothetical protein